MEETFRRSYNRILIIFGRWSVGGGGDKRVIKVHASANLRNLDTSRSIPRTSQVERTRRNRIKS